MAHTWQHAVASKKQWGGSEEDYLPIHDFLDSTKAHMANVRHRALLHNSWGIFLCEKLFGHVVTNSEGRVVPTRLVAEKHVREDCGFIPSVQDWLKHLVISESWMKTVGVKDPQHQDSNFGEGNEHSRHHHSNRNYPEHSCKEADQTRPCSAVEEKTS